MAKTFVLEPTPPPAGMQEAFTSLDDIFIYAIALGYEGDQADVGEFFDTTYGCSILYSKEYYLVGNRERRKQGDKRSTSRVNERRAFNGQEEDHSDPESESVHPLQRVYD